jgi:acyl carrier protein
VRPGEPDCLASTVSIAVKRLLVLESRLSIPPEQLAADEPLNGDRLRINSLGFVGMLIRLEDELDVTLPDDLFVGHTFDTVADVVNVVMRAAAMGQPS